MIIELLLLKLFLGGTATALTVRRLTRSAVVDWLRVQARPPGTYTGVIRKSLENGHFEVVAGVFTNAGRVVTKKSWQAERLDPALAAEFGTKDTIRIEV